MDSATHPGFLIHYRTWKALAAALKTACEGVAKESVPIVDNFYLRFAIGRIPFSFSLFANFHRV